ncbi:P-II family nitrogen regulator [Actinomycetospora termitidis]|uniref:P-II family nitrogen regulator n=1 Tax=Actinomycetospora termitidis TaxID=3053470 RepID=A0ABT7M4L0_9PSEU|nr:P-II family nitrogen regulator [Actinomycetospora sp. Odt1-22]MDL5155381.1 P-II family nitrogen regulator [Actinomycetospora sp. Odt1-22]
MKLLTAVVRPHALDGVRRACERLAVLGMTISEVRVHEAGHVELRKGARIAVDLVPRLRIETVVDDDVVERLVEQIRTNLGDADGHISVRHVDLVLRVRTGEMGHDAV